MNLWKMFQKTVVLVLMVSAIASAELVGYWPLDVAGDTYADKSGLGNDATTTNPNARASWTSEGYQGGGLECTDQQSAPYTIIEAAIPEGLLRANNVTISIWLKVPTSYKAWGVIADLVTETSDLNIEMNNQGSLYAGNGLDSGSVKLNDATWHHAAITYSATTATMYVDGEEMGTRAGATDELVTAVRFYGPRANRSVWATYRGSLDEVVVFNEVLTQEQIQSLMENGVSVTPKAQKPFPATDDEDVWRDIVLRWDAVESAVRRDLYLGLDANDVANADRDNHEGVELVTDLDVNTYDPGRLEFSQTYFWRVDEVNAAPDNTIFTGDVWNFQVEPKAIPILGSNILAAASNNTEEAVKTIDGSGLTDGKHSTNTEDMWLSANSTPWIEYTFDKAYRLEQLVVWNHNSQLESSFGLGAKEVAVSYTEEGSNWIPVPEATQFERAPGLPDYIANTTLSLGGVKAVAVRIEIKNSWGGGMGPGLSEVQFMAIPESARTPVPSQSEVDVNPAQPLSWRAGRNVTTHRVYISTDRQAVEDGSVAPMETDTSSLVVSDMLLDQQYFWRVDEVNGTDVWTGDVWDFNTVAALMVDDFESYNDDDLPIFETWLDGVENDDNGSQCGHWDPPYAEQSIALGSQSLPLYYANDGTAVISEGTRTFESTQDWTVHGADTLVVHYQGLSSVGSVTEDNGVYTIEAAGGDIWGEADYCQYAYASISGDCTIIAKIDSLNAADGWAKAGVMIRDSLDADAMHAMVAVSATNGITFARRLVTGGASTSDSSAGKAAPYWVKLVRSGSTYSAAVSVDGTTWEDLGTPQTVFTDGDDYVGLVLSSHEDRTEPVATAVYTDVSTTPSVNLNQVTEISPDTLNEPERLYVTISDSSNQDATVVLDEAGTTALGWNEGMVNLSDLSSQLNVSRIKTLTVGVGDNTAGTSGIIYIDNIQITSSN